MLLLHKCHQRVAISLLQMTLWPLILLSLLLLLELSKYGSRFNGKNALEAKQMMLCISLEDLGTQDLLLSQVITHIHEYFLLKVCFFSVLEQGRFHFLVPHDRIYLNG